MSYPAAWCTDVFVGLEENDVDFGNEEATQGHWSADIDTHAQCRGLNLQSVNEWNFRILFWFAYCDACMQNVIYIKLLKRRTWRLFELKTFFF